MGSRFARWLDPGHAIEAAWLNMRLHTIIAVIDRFQVRQDLRSMRTGRFVRNPTGAMPKLFPSPLDDAEVIAVATYVRDVLQAAPPRAGPP